MSERLVRSADHFLKPFQAEVRAVSFSSIWPFETYNFTESISGEHDRLGEQA
jgi:hypothetical protein